MRKALSIITALLVFSLNLAIFAEENIPAKTEKRQINENVYLIHNYTPGMMGSQDSLIISENNKELSIFESEGRRIEEVFIKDFDKDGKTEYLVQMDCGGSGGYRDMSLLKQNAQNVFEPVWEESYAMPKVQIHERDGRDSIYIKYPTNPKAEKSPMALAIISFDKKGNISTKDSKDLLK